jgi:hypothetical protein
MMPRVPSHRAYSKELKKYQITILGPFPKPVNLSAHFFKPLDEHLNDSLSAVASEDTIDDNMHQLQRCHRIPDVS